MTITIGDSVGHSGYGIVEVLAIVVQVDREEDEWADNNCCDPQMERANMLVRTGGGDKWVRAERCSVLEPSWAPGLIETALRSGGVEFPEADFWKEQL